MNVKHLLQPYWENIDSIDFLLQFTMQRDIFVLCLYIHMNIYFCGL